MTPRRGRPGFFKVIRFDKTLRGSQNAIRYVAFRSEDVQGKTPHIFDDRSDTAEVNRFMRNLEDRVTRHASAAKAYHTVFSLNRADFNQAGMADWRDVVRQVMRTYELETRRRLEWIASYHDNPTHPHCHVIIKAAYINESGQHKKLILNRNEVQRIKEITSRALEARGLTPQRSAPMRVPEGRGFSPMVGAVGSMLAWLEQQIKEDRRRREREEAERWRRWEEEQEREEHQRER